MGAALQYFVNGYLWYVCVLRAAAEIQESKKKRVTFERLEKKSLFNRWAKREDIEYARDEQLIP